MCFIPEPIASDEYESARTAADWPSNAAAAWARRMQYLDVGDRHTSHTTTAVGTRVKGQGAERTTHRGIRTTRPNGRDLAFTCPNVHVP